LTFHFDSIESTIGKVRTKIDSINAEIGSINAKIKDLTLDITEANIHAGWYTYTDSTTGQKVEDYKLIINTQAKGTDYLFKAGDRSTYFYLTPETFEIKSPGVTIN
jgi:hypothetical protein